MDDLQENSLEPYVVGRREREGVKDSKREREGGKRE